MPPCDRRDEGTALIRLALILEADVVVECKRQDMMETGLSWHPWNFRQEELSGASPTSLPHLLETSSGIFRELGLLAAGSLYPQNWL